MRCYVYQVRSARKCAVARAVYPGQCSRRRFETRRHAGTADAGDLLRQIRGHAVTASDCNTWIVRLEQTVAMVSYKPGWRIHVDTTGGRYIQAELPLTDPWGTRYRGRKWT